MPKLPVLTGADIIKALETLGLVRMRQKGSHVVLRRGAVGTVVPLHRPVKTGTLAGILRQADVSIDALTAALDG